MPSPATEKKWDRTVITPDEAREIARDAYIYGFPMVDSYRIQYSYFVDTSNAEYKGPWNTIHNTSRVYTPADKTVQTPNSDTPYSFIGADLRAEPLVLTVPEIDNGRYYSVQFIDMYTFNFAYVGSRATGNRAGSFLLAGPKWVGVRPEGVTAVIRSETELAFVLYRTQLFNPDDIANIKKIQAGYRVQTLSEFLGRPASTSVEPISFVKPLSAYEERRSLRFFSILNFLLQFCPTHSTEETMMQRFSRLQIGAGKTFNEQSFPDDLREAIEEGVADAWQKEKEVLMLISAGKVVPENLFGAREAMKNNFVYRMAAAAGGIYGNSKEEASYHMYFLDSEKEPLDTSVNEYVIRFAPGQLPPANAFWSVTLYEMPSQLLSANKLNRYLFNSPMLPALKKDKDGGLTIYVSHRSPGRDKESNWLPAPSCMIKVALRLYAPKPEAAQWKAPPIEKRGW